MGEVPAPISAEALVVVRNLDGLRERCGLRVRWGLVEGEEGKRSGGWVGGENKAKEMDMMVCLVAICKELCLLEHGCFFSSRLSFPQPQKWPNTGFVLWFTLSQLSSFDDTLEG